jgi:hypothetical protein
MLKFLAAFLLIMHGLAHVTGPIGLWGSGRQAFADRPWIFSTGVTARSLVGRLWGCLWLLAAFALLGAGLGLLFDQAWWPLLAVVGAGISLVAIGPWLKVVPPGAWAGALFDLLILVALLSRQSGHIVELVG